ncbi:MAG: hypothetical protein S4CHLAM45_14790 [Chlamydiales bacterium]|nr:hypothetical protein [Chlamydiales bacterium]MCH9620560.1 hypothetical protein [Chlamydiales bacterium]MCH9623568.1 hypothetical protein [Chlamydiales bacterium]
MDPINPLTRYSPPPYLIWTELQDKNKATHIPPEEFQELVSFLKTHSPEMATAIEQGSLLKQTKLDLSSKGLTQLPSSLRHLTNLTELDVSGNKLIDLPDTIGQLTNLTQLNVSINQLTVLPNTIAQLTNLTKLDVYKNQLADLPSSIGDLSLLERLQVYDNPYLSNLPVYNCSQLTDFSIKGTRILQHEIKRLREVANVVEEWPDLEFTEEQKENLYRWLLRLVQANNFNRNRKELVKTICAVLETVHTDAEFREIFFYLIAGDLTACSDRAVMSLNLVYTSWKLYTLPAEASLSEKVQLLVGCGRALKLRNLVLQNPGYENAEKILYAEVKLRERLGLVTAITSMMHEDIGHVEGSVIKAIAQEIEEIPDAKLVVEFNYWENYLEEHHAPELSKIKDEIKKARKTLLALLENDRISEREYQSRDKELQAQEQEAILQLTQQIIDGIQPSEAVAQS